MSVKVGVRVRPYNQRQLDLNCRLCVDMFGPTTRLFDADDEEKHRDFTFDYSFWSHDQFTPDERGYFVPDSDKYADQQLVFEKVGLEILSNAWEGYHCCLFAYGQTGAGKSYSMVGYGANKGIVPISCEQIFKRISQNEDKQKEYEVNVSMLQIYNEKVQDLLVPIHKRNKDGYKIREHKTLGIYVQNLSKHCVDTYQSIEEKMNEGSKNRSIAATEMNASSSRAHTIISIEFKQFEIIQGKKRQKLSVIHLVDLAGSEKVGKTGATGDRLKEAAGINKSLSALGLVISTLADKAMGKGKKGVIVPYRDSCLTRILQNALGGNSKTLMICAISPATDNYEETLSTLRYADQAKKIQNKAVVNESQTDKMIRNLTAEKDELKDKVAKFQQMFQKLSQGLGIDAEKLREFNDAKEQLEFNTAMINDFSMTKAEKLQNEKEQTLLNNTSKIDLTKPHLSNLNEDPQLSRRINYSIDIEVSNIGRRNIQPANDIEIGGMGIRSLHAKILKEEDGLYIEPIFSGDDSGCYLNGDVVSEKVILKTLDRLTFGTNNMFIVVIPETEPRDDIKESKINWDFAQNQLYLKKEQIEQKLNEERQKKIKEQAQAILRKKQQELEELQKKLLENEEERKNMEQQKQIERAEMQKRLREEEAEKLRREIEKDKKKIKEKESQSTERIKEKYYFEKKLLKTLPKCIELNLIAKEFKRNISMSVKMLMHSSDPDDEDDFQMKKRSIKVKVVNREVGYSYWWDTQKLSNRYYIIKDHSEQYFETGHIPEFQQKDDPFWDPPEPVMIGRAFLTTKALSYMFDNPTNLSIIGEDDQCGELIVNMVPTDETGTKNLCQEMDQQEDFQPEYLLDNPFHFNMIIEEAKVPDNFENIFVEYAIKVSEFKTQTFKTDVCPEKGQTSILSYKHLHSYSNINQQMLEYLMTAKVIFKVYGNEIIKQDTKQEDSKKSNQSPVTPVSQKKSEEPQISAFKAEQQVESPEQNKKPKGEKKKVTKKEPKTSIPPPEGTSKISNSSNISNSKLPDQIRAKKEAELKDPKRDPKKLEKKSKDGKDKDDCRLF